MKKLAIIGCGLMGGSVAAAVKAHKSPYQIHGYDLNETSLQWGLDNQLLDHTHTVIEDCVSDSDIVIIASPIKQLAGLIKTTALYAPSNSAICDLGSIKSKVISQLKGQKEFPTNYVPTHPIAGTEKSGIQHAKATLFNNREVILCPEPETQAQAITTIEFFWQQLGAKITQLNAQQHDEYLAHTSHMPHVLAYTLLAMLNEKYGNEIFKYAGSGLRDLTRIANSNPDMWKQITQHNDQEVIKSLDHLINALQTSKTLIEKADLNGLQEVLTLGHTTKQKFEKQYKSR